MSRSRKQMDELEELHHTIKELNKEIKNLKRTIANLKVEPKKEKSSNSQPNNDIKFETLPKKEKPLPKNGIHTPLDGMYRCPDCHGNLQKIELGIRTIIHCISCGYKVTLKN